MVMDNRSIGGVTLHSIERARFLPPIKIICWSTIGSSLELVFYAQIHCCAHNADKLIKIARNN